MSEAINKIKTEMEANKNNSYIQVVGGFLLQHLEVNPADAEKILTDDKTIAKSLDEMSKVAQKKKVGNCAVLTNQEGFEVVLKYFGIDTKPAPTVIKPVQIVSKVDDFDIKLDDLL